MRKQRIGSVVLLLLLLLLAASSPSSAGQGPASTSTIKGFHPIGDYVLEIDGVKDPLARFYLAEQVPAILIQSPELSPLVVLEPGSSGVKKVPAANLAKHPDGTADLSLDATGDAGKFQIFASWIVFKVDGRELTLKERPWLLAQQDIKTLESYNPEFAWRAAAYTPDHSVIEALKSQSTDVKVRVFFGSWCPHCKRKVPLMIKVAKELAGSHIHIDYYGLPRGWSTHPVAGPLGIRSVPTGIVTIDGKEVGRITGGQWNAPETALKEILEKQKASSPP